MTWNDPFNNAYKKLFFNKAGTKLLGGILVGDASDYTTLLASTTPSKHATVLSYNTTPSLWLGKISTEVFATMRFSVIFCFYLVGDGSDYSLYPPGKYPLSEHPLQYNTIPSLCR